MTFSWISVCLNRSSPARIDLFAKHIRFYADISVYKFKALPVVTHDRNNSTSSPSSDILSMKNLKNATMNRNVFIKRCPQGSKLKQIEQKLNCKLKWWVMFILALYLHKSGGFRSRKNIQICNSNLIIRQILLVFDVLTVFDETEIISEFIMAAFKKRWVDNECECVKWSLSPHPLSNFRDQCFSFM